MAELKQGRWVKVHEPGQANFVENENVMDIVIARAGVRPTRLTRSAATRRRLTGWPSISKPLRRSKSSLTRRWTRFSPLRTVRTARTIWFR